MLSSSPLAGGENLTGFTSFADLIRRGIASAQVLAAVGGDGRLEHDVMDNPLREALIEPFPW